MASLWHDSGDEWCASPLDIPEPLVAWAATAAFIACAAAFFAFMVML